jgi:hypothetical protein
MKEAKQASASLLQMFKKIIIKEKKEICQILE